MRNPIFSSLIALVLTCVTSLCRASPFPVLPLNLTGQLTNDIPFSEWKLQMNLEPGPMYRAELYLRSLRVALNRIPNNSEVFHHTLITTEDTSGLPVLCLEQTASSLSADEQQYLTNNRARLILLAVGLRLSRKHYDVHGPVSWAVWRGTEDIFTIARGRMGPSKSFLTPPS